MRDRSLDIIKGIACILMIFAHSKTLGKTIDNQVTSYFWYFGFFAPVIFFGSIGVSLLYQLRKRTIPQIALFNLIFFFITFSYIGRKSLDYFTIDTPNLFSSLALGTILALFLLRMNGLLIFILLILLDRLLNNFPIPANILHGQLFSLIPWLGFIFLGNYLYKHKNHSIFFIITGALISLYYILVRHQYLESQDPTTLFLSISFLIYPILISISNLLEKFSHLSGLLIYLGRNSLLFFWLHTFLLYLLPVPLPAYLIWIIILTLSISTIYLLKKANIYTLEKVSTTLWFWVILIISVFIPKLFNFPLEINFYYFYFVLFIFSLNYHQFYKIKNIFYHLKD